MARSYSDKKMTISAAPRLGDVVIYHAEGYDRPAHVVHVDGERAGGTSDSQTRTCDVGTERQLHLCHLSPSSQVLKNRKK